MTISDIYADAAEALGFAHQEKVFRRITDAIEALANKGSWEPLLAYVLIPVTDNQFVQLPDSVEAPIRVALDSNPAFSRGRLYEFTMNGPGYFANRVEWSWEDLGEYNYKIADDKGNVSAEGRNTKRVIRISKPGSYVRMLVRLRTTKVTSLQDWIPLHSKLAIIMMLKALENYRKGSPQDFQLGQAQEAQALKFLQEEQQSRQSSQELAQMDAPRIIGYQYHSPNMVVVQDIYDEASSIIGGAGKVHVFDAISEALECLSNKGQWDALTGYLTMAPSSDVVGLPRQVEMPIRINIEKKPTMARDRLYEFTVNGPGTDLTELTTLTWEDQGSGPTQRELDPPSTISFDGSAANAGKHVTLRGIDDQDREVTHVYLIPATGHISAPTIWKELYSVNKDVMEIPIAMRASYGPLAVYQPDETLPSFRQIKLSKAADEIRIMYRRSSLKVSTVNDIIPLKSRSAILNMMRSLQLYKLPDLSPDKIQMAQALEQNALKYLQEEEQSKLAYIQASLKDNMPALGVNWNSREVVTAGDVYDDAADIFGAIGRQRLFDKITEAQEMLANKSQWDGLDGYVDIMTDQRGYMSLPRKVEVILGMNFCRTPAQMRSRWYEFHMNGMGSTCGECSNFYDDLGSYPIIQEPPTPVRIYAITNFESDADCKVRVYGYDQIGNWIRSLENGVYVDGEAVPVTVRRNAAESPELIPVTDHEFNQITRVTKDVSDMQIELWGGTTNYIPQDFTSPPMLRPIAPPPPAPPPPPGEAPVTPWFLAYYDSDETEPMFRRIRVPVGVTWSRIRFRKSTLKITKMDDVINMKSKTALTTMMRALKGIESGQIEAANTFAMTATQLISEEETSRKPGETFTLQFDTGTCFADPLQGQY